LSLASTDLGKQINIFIHQNEKEKNMRINKEVKGDHVIPFEKIQTLLNS
jgi:hypothetical protein